jgi:hypothetical protein
MSSPVQILFPAGRLLMGSLYKPQEKDADGNPLKIKSGPNAGQPRVDYFFALGIRKGAETHWGQTPWGAEIWKAGHLAFPQAAAAPSFAWKVVDGDSATPNRKGKKPCDREGYPGHWVVTFSGGFAPKVYQIPPGAKEPVIWPQPDAVNLGDFVEVYGNCSGNNSVQQPGVFINHSMVCFRGYGDRIVLGPDAAAVGFGATALPAGASAVPTGAALPAPGAPGAPAAPAVAMPPPPVITPAPTAPPIPAASIPSHMPLPATATPPAPPAPPVPAGPSMTPKAGAFTYEQFIAGGWTDDKLRESGYMV